MSEPRETGNTGQPSLAAYSSPTGTPVGAILKSPTPIRVLLADDHPVVRLGIRTELERLDGVQLIGEANDGEEAVTLATKECPDIVLMDISMPGLRGLDATAAIVKERPQIRVIILSRWDNEEYYWGALRAGASGYLLKKGAVSELGAALTRVMGGEIYLSKEISNRLVKKFPLQRGPPYPRSPLESLTERQREVLQLIAEGQTTQGIALILKVSVPTVEYHRGKLMEVLNIYDIPGLVRFALRNGLPAGEP